MLPILLIVDDEPRIFQALRRTLHREGLQLMQASSGEEALEILSRFPADIVMADENMPGMTGTQLLGLVRQRWPDTIRMLLTGTAKLDVVVRAVNQGHISRFFTKPCDDAELIVAIRELLAEKAQRQGARAAQPAAVHPAPASPATPAAGREPQPMSLGTAGSAAAARPPRNASPEIRIDSDDVKSKDVDALLADLRRSLDDLAK